ncbi:MAG: hypothetical protein EOM90_01760 [Alphaproteobacteria bacterium]|nr:hypothetical protein [Alphaproteobacteria bacterium]
MAYPIHHIKDYIPENHPCYFCDANVWIAILKCYGLKGVTSEEVPYQDFFEAIINLNEIRDPVVAKRIKHRPKVILTSLLLSEIINAYMRNVAMKLFFGGGDTYKSHNYKSDYRENPHSDYKKQIKTLTSDLCAFQDYVILIDDDFTTISPFSFLPSLAALSMDFNDLYYYHFLKGKNIPFVTHDKDCLFQDIPVITSQSALLMHSTI